MTLEHIESVLVKYISMDKGDKKEYYTILRNYKDNFVLA